MFEHDYSPKTSSESRRKERAHTHTHRVQVSQFEFFAIFTSYIKKKLPSFIHGDYYNKFIYVMSLKSIIYRLKTIERA